MAFEQKDLEKLNKFLQTRQDLQISNVPLHEIVSKLIEYQYMEKAVNNLKLGKDVQTEVGKIKAKEKKEKEEAEKEDSE
jgi:hypothetical protein